MTEWKDAVEWYQPEPVVRFARFEKPGDVVVGWVIHYHPTYGAQNYDRTADTGVVVLEDQPQRWIKIGLDKGQLATAVANALITARAAWRLSPGDDYPRIAMAIRFIGRSEGTKGHKQFKVTIGKERI